MHLPRLRAVRLMLGNLKLRNWLVEALIFLILVIGLSVWQNRQLPGGAAPALQGIRTDGVRVHKSDWLAPATGKSTLLVFWATWCPVCRLEAGNIEAIAGDWPVISVAMQSGDAAAIRRYMKEHGIQIPALVDEDGRMSSTWNVRSTPTHFIIDSSGNIRFRVVGYATEIGLLARLWWADHW